MTDPLSHSVTYSYDNANQLTAKTDRNGRQTTYLYDSIGRLTGETWVSASPSEIITYTYDADSEMTGAVDANARLTYTYDSGGRAITAATSGTAGQPSVTLTSTFDALGNPTSLTDNLSSVGRTTYSYDSAERLTTIAQSLGGVAGPQVVFGYDAANRLITESRQVGTSGTATEVNTTFSYDNANRLTTITDGTAAYNPFPPGWILTPLATYVYGYDNANRLTSEKNAEGTVSYTYDASNELTGASGSRAETYTYDSGGNRTMSGYSTGLGNELTASPGTTYTYDNEGNLVASANTSTHVVTSYTYDYHNRLTGVTVGGTAVATYTYDPLDRRIGFKDSGTQTWVVWNGKNPYADFNGSSVLQQRYLYGQAVDELFARTSSGGTTSWYLTDRLGTVRDIVNSAGSVIDHLSYDSYGKLLTESNSANGDRFKFTGRELDGTTGLQDNRARVYSSGIGRWLSQDPIGFVSGDNNLYRYCHNSITNSVDLNGTSDWLDWLFPANVNILPGVDLGRIGWLTLPGMSTDPPVWIGRPGWYPRVDGIWLPTGVLKITTGTTVVITGNPIYPNGPPQMRVEGGHVYWFPNNVRNPFGDNPIAWLTNPGTGGGLPYIYNSQKLPVIPWWEIMPKPLVLPDIH